MSLVRAKGRAELLITDEEWRELEDIRTPYFWKVVGNNERIEVRMTFNERRGGDESEPEFILESPVDSALFRAFKAKFDDDFDFSDGNTHEFTFDLEVEI